MNSKNSLILDLQQKGILKTPSVIKAFNTVKRSDFVTPHTTSFSYHDQPLSIGFGQTISQPTTVAFMLEKLGVKEGDNVLDLGSGSGWTTALLASIVGTTGKVTGVEIISELVSYGSKNLSKYNFSNAQIISATNELGSKENAPFDKILVSAAAKELPNVLLDQLKVGGTLVIPVLNSIYKVVKVSEDKINKEEYHGYVFVPLVYETS